MKGNKNLINASMKSGLYLGVAMTIFTLAIWGFKVIENSGLMGGFFINITKWVIMVIILVLFTKKYRDVHLNRTITFSQAFSFGLYTILFSALILAIYNFIFHSMIDPEYAQRVLEIMPEKMYNFLTNIGAPEDAIEEAMAKFEEADIEGNIPTVMDNVKGGLINSLIGGAILSLISGAIVKKNKPASAFDAAMNEIDED